MALTPATIYQALAANRASGIFPLSGLTSDQLFWGIANGVSAWAISQPQNLALRGTAVGLAGVGIIAPATTRLVLVPSLPVMLGALSGAGIQGQVSSSLASTVAYGLAQAIVLSGQYSGTAAGVGTGADVSQVTVANSGTLISVLSQTLAVFGSGPALPLLATGLGNGIAGLLLLATGLGAVTGSTTVPPASASGLTISVVV